MHFSRSNMNNDINNIIIASIKNTTNKYIVITYIYIYIAWKAAASVNTGASLWPPRRRRGVYGPPAGKKMAGSWAAVVAVSHVPNRCHGRR